MNTCSSHTHPNQSPVNIEMAAVKSGTPHDVRVTNSTACPTVTYAVYGWKYDTEVEECPFEVSFNGTRYNPTAIHCHTPSEHSINNTFYDGECHIVLMGKSGSRQGKVFVLTTFLSTSADTSNSFIATIWNSSNYPSGPTNTPLQPNDLLQHAGRNMVVYQGQGTTPPCGEDYIFAIFTQAVPIARSQLDRYRGPLGLGGMPQPSNGANARPVQPFGSRPRPEHAVFNMTS